MKRWELSRRTLLRGAGVTVALPLLEQMLPSVARAEAASPPRRFLAFYVPCGINMATWTPAATGAGYALPSTLESLAPVKAKTLVLTGLANRPAQPDGFGDHAAGTGSFLTVAHCLKTQGTNIRNGISADQVAANALKGSTRFPSLELGIDGGGTSGDCDSGYSCAYVRNIAWASATQPLAKETNPLGVFERLFGSLDPNASAAALAKRKLYRKSVLDFVRQDATGLQAKLGRSDNRKLDEYLTGVRELEQRIDQLPTGPACTPGAPPAPPTDIRAHTQAMLDLIVKAFECDLTRVATFMLNNGLSNYPFNFLGISEGHHSLSHHQGIASNLSQLATINRWEVSQFAYLLQELDKRVESDGTLLDNSVCFFSSEIEDGNSHSHANMPILVGGSGGKKLSTGRHVRFPETTVANLLITLLSTVGVNLTRFGDNGTGPLSW